MKYDVEKICCLVASSFAKGCGIENPTFDFYNTSKTDNYFSSCAITVTDMPDYFFYVAQLDNEVYVKIVSEYMKYGVKGTPLLDKVINVGDC